MCLALYLKGWQIYIPRCLKPLDTRDFRFNIKTDKVTNANSLISDLEVTKVTTTIITVTCRDEKAKVVDQVLLNSEQIDTNKSSQLDNFKLVKAKVWRKELVVGYEMTNVNSLG